MTPNSNTDRLKLVRMRCIGASYNCVASPIPKIRFDGAVLIRNHESMLWR